MKMNMKMVLPIFLLYFQIRIVQLLICDDNQFLATIYQQNDKQTQQSPTQACLDQSFSAGFFCLDQKYYTTTFAGNLVYKCIQCDNTIINQSNYFSVISYEIQLDSGNNYCGYYKLYDSQCALYSSLSSTEIQYKQFNFSYSSRNNTNSDNTSINNNNTNNNSLLIAQKIYTCIQCKNSQNWILQFFIQDSQNQTFRDYFCQAKTPIFGKSGGESCLIYYSQQLKLQNDSLSTNLICSQCYSFTNSMDCSYSCGKNQYQIQFGLSVQSSQVVCLQGGGQNGYDNSYLANYQYNCILYSFYDSFNKILGPCIQSIPPLNLVVNGQTIHAGKIPGCVLIDYTLTKCLQCSVGYLLRINTNDCIMILPNCKNYATSGQCSQCISRYYLSNRQCLQIPDSCITYTSTGNCLTCIQNYTIIDSSCVATSSIPNYPIFGCYLQYQSSCITCLDGYTLSSNSKICTKNYQDCPLNSTSTRYQLINNICISIDINCKYYLQSGYCYECLRGYYQFDGKCYAQ